MTVVPDGEPTGKPGVTVGHSRGCTGEPETVSRNDGHRGTRGAVARESSEALSIFPPDGAMMRGKVIIWASMGFYDKFLLPRVVHFTCGLKPAMRQRQKIVPLAEGRVLEIGIGSGLNIPFYDSDKVSHLWGLDPSEDMWAIAGRNAAEHHLDAEFLAAEAASIPLEDNAADTVVTTYTMCTIPEVAPALAEVRRVLKPGGRLLFCEHGEAPDESVRRWQRRMNPLWNVLGGGCNLNRPIPRLLEASGFDVQDLQTMYIPGWKPACFNYWGSARYR